MRQGGAGWQGALMLTCKRTHVPSAGLPHPINDLPPAFPALQVHEKSILLPLLPLSMLLGKEQPQLARLLERCPELLSWPAGERAGVLFGQLMGLGLSAAGTARCFE